MELKYIRHKTLGFILWPADTALHHANVGKVLVSRGGDKIVSAGFARITERGARCYGESESLQIRSFADDSEALTKQLGLGEG